MTALETSRSLLVMSEVIEFMISESRFAWAFEEVGGSVARFYSLVNIPVTLIQPDSAFCK